MQAGRRTTALAAAFALLVGSFGLASCGSEDDESAGTTTTTTTDTTTGTASDTTTTTTEPPGPAVVSVTVVDGAPRGGIVRATVDEGERVALVVRSDVADEIHLHGYDLSRDIPAGGIVRIAFRADVPGRFEVELEQRGAQIAELTVQP